MIIIKLYGGLGNQMFQYAFGKALEYKKKKKVIYDLSWFQDKSLQGNSTIRNFELNVFSISILTLNSNNLLGYILKRKNLIQKVIYKILNTIGYLKDVKEKKAFDLDLELLSAINSRSNIHGHFQTELYFKNIRKEILAHFRPKNRLSKNSLNFKKQIENSNSISLHFRRGDYITDQKANEVHGLCDLSYYKKAIKLIQSKFEQPHFFIFSDDLEWVIHQNWLQGLQVTLVAGNTGKKSYEDMVLMSLCKHNIIANSSFSWWGAWLNNYNNKIVIAPKLWYANPKINESVTNLLPMEWIKL